MRNQGTEYERLPGVQFVNAAFAEGANLTRPRGFREGWWERELEVVERFYFDPQASDLTLAKVYGIARQNVYACRWNGIFNLWKNSTPQLQAQFPFSVELLSKNPKFPGLVFNPTYRFVRSYQVDLDDPAHQPLPLTQAQAQDRELTRDYLELPSTTFNSLAADWSTGKVAVGRAIRRGLRTFWDESSPKTRFHFDLDQILENFPADKDEFVRSFPLSTTPTGRYAALIKAIAEYAAQPNPDKDQGQLLLDGTSRHLCEKLAAHGQPLLIGVKDLTRDLKIASFQMANLVITPLLNLGIPIKSFKHPIKRDGKEWLCHRYFTFPNFYEEARQAIFKNPEVLAKRRKRLGSSPN